MPDDPDDLPPEVRRAVAVIEAFRAAAPRVMPTPANLETAEAFQRRMEVRRKMTGEREFVEFAPHLRHWFDSLSPEDIAKLNKVIGLKTTTIDWIDGKNDKELAGLDSAVEFVSSSRTAAKVLMYVAGIAFTILGGAITYAKLAAEFLTIKGGVK